MPAFLQDNELKLDRLGLTLSLISFMLLISAYGFYFEYNRIDDTISEKIAVGLSIVNPSDSVGLSFEEQNEVFINEPRAILLVYLVSLLLGLISFFRLILFRIRGIDTHNSAGLTALSIGLVTSNIYLIVTSGLLADV